MTKVLRTAPHRFLGMNVRGTPSMSWRKVRHDLRVLKASSSVGVVQEFRWPWYWRQAAKVLQSKGSRWASSPSLRAGLGYPISGAQAVFWDRRIWRRHGTLTQRLHAGQAGISEDRYLRSVLLEDKATGLRCWFGTTHFVVGGDRFTSEPQRLKLMEQDLRALDQYLGRLRVNNHPVIFQLDANIHTGTPVYKRLTALLEKHGARLHGDHGVEYLFSINGSKARVEPVNSWEIPVARLRTDHEARGMTFRLLA